jgi:hypothetical protein
VHADSTITAARAFIAIAYHGDSPVVSSWRLSEHIRIPGVPSLVARAGTGLVFTDRARTTWVDLATWPPRLVERDESTLDAALAPSGTWLAYVRRNDRWSLRWYASIDAAEPMRDEPEPVPLRDFAPLLASLPDIDRSIELAHEMRIESLHFHGERALVVPRHVGLGDRHFPYLEDGATWRELVDLPPFDKTNPRDRCPTACLRLGDGNDVVVWNGHVPFSAHRLELAWYHAHAPLPFGDRALLACDARRVVELSADALVAHLPGVAATSIQRGASGTFVVETSSVPIWWSPGEDWACELVPDIIGRRSDVVGVAPDGGLVVYDRREHALAHVTAGELAALPRRRASDAPIVPVRAPIAILDELGAASRARIAGVGDQIATCDEHTLRFHLGDRAAGVDRFLEPLVAVAHNGRGVAAIDARGTLHERTVRSARTTVALAGHPRALVAGPGSAWLAVVSQGAWLVDVDAIARGEPPISIALPGALAAAVDPAGTVLLVAEGARLATWRAGSLVELPTTIEQLVACAPLGAGRFACAGERHLFAFDVESAELELFELSHTDDAVAYATVRAPYVAASPSGRFVAWTATRTSIHVAAVHGTRLELVLDIFYADEYSQPLDTPLVLRGLAFTDETTLAVALDAGRGNLIDIAAQTARKLDPQLGDVASRWILFVGNKPLVAE